MANHEHYREICAMASSGQATPEELLELENHLAECDSCGRAYFDYLRLAARQYAERSDNPTMSPGNAQESLNSALFVQRFFERAQREGIRFSSDVEREIRCLAPVPRSMPRRIGRLAPAEAVAAVALFCLVGWAGYRYGQRSFAGASPVLDMAGRDSTGAAVAIVDLSQRVAELAAANAGLEAKIARLNSALEGASARLRATETNLDLTARDRAKLAASQAALQTQLQRAQQALAQSQALALAAQQEAAKQRNNTSALDAALADDQLRINSYSGKLAEKSAIAEQEGKLLALSSDVTDLMGARNLHIVDVVDTDSSGRTRRAFGRIFFTENKSLIFYAYDLNETPIKKTNYEYRVWGKQEGSDGPVQSLGIFYSDNKAQRRWVFKCDDPKILRSIDSVFVTLEPSDSNSNRPHGPNLMYAYLRGQPNHP